MRSHSSLQNIFVLLALSIIWHESIVPVQSTGSPNWSICDNYSAGECQNGVGVRAYFWNVGSGVTSASVNGLYLFFASGHHGEESGAAQFLFQEHFGTYQDLNVSELGGPLLYLQDFGPRNWRVPAITVSSQPELITHLPRTYMETTGGRNDCVLDGEPVKSFVIHGSERWQLFGQDGNSICVQVMDTFSLIPGIVTNLEATGIYPSPLNLCAVVRGCDLPATDVYRISNTATTGILRR